MDIHLPNQPLIPTSQYRQHNGFWFPAVQNLDGSINVVVGSGTTFNSYRYGHTQGMWIKEGISRGYDDTLRISNSLVSVGAGTTSLITTTVPTNELWTYNNIVIFHTDPVARQILVYLNSGGLFYMIDRVLAHPVSAPLIIRNEIILEATDKIRVDCVGLAVGQTVQFQSVGWKTSTL